MAILKDDVDHLSFHLKSSVAKLANKKIFITGGTGFFGKWLLETFKILEDQYHLGCSIVVLSRDPDKFQKSYPDFANCQFIKFIKGDIATFDFPQDHFDYIIHAATEVSSMHLKQDANQLEKSMVDATKRVLQFAEKTGAKKVLYTSSGAVYADPAIPYGLGKLKSEQAGIKFSKESGVDFLIARCFAFVGPFLPLDGNFAIGNFIADGLNGRDISVAGDGSAIRSYLYAADLVIELINILVDGESCKIYDIGSAESISIGELAALIAKFFPNCSVKINGAINCAGVNSYYLPKHGIIPLISLEEAIRKTINWHRSSLTK